MRYSAMLLFQFRVDGTPATFRTCEKRLIVFEARSAKLALQKARSRGSAAHYDYENSDGNRVWFELVGVLDLVNLDGVCEEDEMWYDIVTMKLPSERAAEILPSDESLLQRGG